MMQNYIILNGNISTNITGLMIQELPPISKPKQRVQTEEIDGRDGDIITPLGYGAYDKEFLIGLSYNYDIDEVIAYFNTSGTVTFSNEEDKYYNYEIIEQINFERLIRYKTAKVRMHIQPFKYSVEDNSKTYTFTEDNEQLSIYNVGNIYSKPTLTITGTGNIGISLNGVQIFQIELGTIGSITIDTTQMEAYQGTTLLNRIVTGNYDNFKLNVGKNTITFTGSVTSVEIENFSRWI